MFQLCEWNRPTLELYATQKRETSALRLALRDNTIREALLGGIDCLEVCADHWTVAAELPDDADDFGLILL